MEPQMTPIIPIKQVLVSFAGHEFLAVQLPGGQIAVVFRHFCEAIHLDFWGQIERIQANPTLSRNFLLVRISTPGGPQVVYALALSVLSLWLGGFRLGRLSEEKRRIIVQLQEHAEAAFSRPFEVSETKTQQSAPPKDEAQQSALPPPEPEPFPPLGDEARYEYQESMYHAHDGLERHLRAIDAGLLTLTKQMAEVRQVVNQHATILNEHLEALVQHKEMLEQHREQLRELKAQPAGESRQVSALAEQIKQLEARVSALAAQVAHLEAARSLTLEHQAEVRTRIRALAHQTGKQAPALERELAAAVGVEAVSQLSEAIWDEVAAWFHQRLGW